MSTRSGAGTGSGRWGVAAILVSFIAINALLSDRYRLVPGWLVYLLVVLALVPIAIAAMTRTPAWRVIERAALFVVTFVAFATNGLNMADIVIDIVTQSRKMDAMTLFSTSIVIWLGNMLIFTLLYWLIDRGGPDARAAGSTAYPDFDFPAMDGPSLVPPDWRPSMVDYLFIGFTTTTAFSPTEAMPISARAKALVMVQSLISLIVVAVIAARAVGIFQ